MSRSLSDLGGRSEGKPFLVKFCLKENLLTLNIGPSFKNQLFKNTLVDIDQVLLVFIHHPANNL